MLASESGAVLLVRLARAGGEGYSLHVEQTLQSNYNHVAISPDPPNPEWIGYGFPTEDGFRSGQEYIIFVSYDRGGDCLAAAFTYNGPNSALTLVPKSAHFGSHAPEGYQLGARFVSMPTSMSYDDLLQRLYPTGGELDPTDTAEWFCPGP